MGKKIVFLVVLLVGSLLVIGCQSRPAISDFKRPSDSKKGKKDKKRAKKEADPAKEKQGLPSAGAIQYPIGTVHMVDQAGRFILIKSHRTTELDPESTIYAYSSDAQISSKLKASPARKGAYLTADMVEGTPKVGDIVMILRTISKPSQSNPTQDSGSLPSDVQVLE